MSEKTESPVGLAISKRLRAIKKRVGKAEQIEQQVADGKAINADQEETMKSKAGCVAAIEELSKLESLLREAMAEEIKNAKEEWVREEAMRREAEEAKRAAEKEVEAEVEQVEEKAPEPAAMPEASRNYIVEDAIHQLVPLVYFSKMFDQSYAQLLSEAPGEREACIQRLMQEESVRKQERFACYSWVNQASPQDDLKHQDMDLIVQFGKLLTGRPAGQLISHEMAVQQCCALAQKFVLQGSDVLPDLGTDGAYLADQVAKIKASEYFTVKPEFSTVQQDNFSSEQQAAEPQQSDVKETPQEESSGAPAASAPPSAPPAPATPELWPYMLQPQSTAGMPPVPVDGVPPIGQVPVSRPSVADQLLPGHPHPYAQPGMPINFGHPGGFIMPQHAGGMPPMLPPGAYDHMFQGVPYGMPPPGMDVLPMGEGAVGMPNVAPNGGPAMAPGSSNQADGGQVGGGSGGRVNARQPGGAGDRGRGNRNRGGQRGGGGERGQDNRSRGGNRNRSNYDGGRGGGRGGGNRGGQQQVGSQGAQQPPPPPAV